MDESNHQPAPERTNALIRRLDQAARIVHVLVAAAALGGIVYMSTIFTHAVIRRQPKTVPPSMTDVRWQSPDSSIYCLACHKAVAPAVGGRDVAHGHSLNVGLNDAQRRAIQDMNAVVGTDDTLICMSCHTIGRQPRNAYMLADALTDSRLCMRCHPHKQPTCDWGHDLRTSAPDERNRLGQTPDEGGPCSACHLAHHYAREFEPCDADPDGRCITCHQLYRCAPVVERKADDHPNSRCAECHDPHQSCEASFLRQPANELCLTCHAELAGGPASGMHPLGDMPFPVPDELLAAGALAGVTDHEITCLTCHATHRATEAPLLLLHDTNALCLACHRDELAAAGPGGDLTQHGQGPFLTAQQQERVRSWGGRIGDDGELLCTSCHRIHGGGSWPTLLAFPQTYQQTCIACHTDQAKMIGSAHDLRVSCPDADVITSAPSGQPGACRSCHMAHQSVQPPTPTAGDPMGQCVACHQLGGWGQSKTAALVAHPQTTCTDCHNPHEPRVGSFLSEPTDALCAKCHPQLATLVGGPHDRVSQPDAWHAWDTPDGSRCLACHVPHGDDQTDLLRFLMATGNTYHDDACLFCHPDAGWDTGDNLVTAHPHKTTPDQDKVELALVPTDDVGGMRMGCRTCHDPHGGAVPSHLARVLPGAPTESLCLHCHTKQTPRPLSGHATERLAQLGFAVESCKPCHAMHVSAPDTWGDMLIPSLLPGGTAVAAAKGEMHGPCTNCHHYGGPGPIRDRSTHQPIVNPGRIPPDAPGYMPLFDAAGKEDPDGQIACRTCHLAHARHDLAQSDDPDPSQQLRQQAMWIHVRPFVAPNLCTECHGPDGRVRFLRFHTPAVTQ